jgi:hypothetical protein
LGIISPTDFHIFQRGRYTTNQIRHTPQIIHFSRIINQPAIGGPQWLWKPPWVAQNSGTMPA